MQIKVNWNASQEGGCVTFDLHELEVSSPEHWEALDDDKKEALVQQALDGLSEQPYMVTYNIREV